MFKTLLALLLFLGVAVGLQYASGAYGSAFSGYFDEPAHYVTGLMVRDYLAAGLPGPPLAYAQDYYLHYPEVALGQWPPVFYVIQAGWTLLFSPHRISVLLLMAALASLLALAVFLVGRKEWSTASGLVAGLLLLALPINQASTSQIMADLPVALFSFLAILALGRYLDSPRWTDAAAFGVLASIAILTKGTGLALALAPPLAVVFSRRLGLMRRLSFWLPVIIVAAVCGPWYALTARGVVDTFIYPGGAMYVVTALRAFSFHFGNVLGLALFPLVCVGAVSRLRREGPDVSVSGRWAAIVALPVSIFLFHSFVSAGYEGRYVVSATPALVLLALAGIATAAAYLPPWTSSLTVRHWLLTAACAIVFLGTTFHIPQKRLSGYIEAAEAILATPEFRHSVIMVSTYGVHWNGEGMLIAEIAMREQRPGHYVIRATKALSRIDWNATEEQPFYDTPEEVLAFLDSVPIGGLVLDMTPRVKAFRHHDLLVRTVRAHPERFVLMSVHPLSRPPGQVAADSIHVYRVAGNENPPPERLYLDRERLLTPRAEMWR